MSHRKYWYGLAALAFAVSAVRAAPPLAINPTGGHQKATADEPAELGGAYPLVVNANYCTGFEASDGWDLGFSLCGADFSTCVGNVDVGNVCNIVPPSTHAANGNCCDKDPNVDTGWFMNGLARHCREPHIDNIHPSNLKNPGSLQHLRMQYDPTGGNPPGCLGFGSACRQRWSAPWDRGQKQINKTTYKYDISFSHGFIGTATRIRNFFGNIINGGGIFVHAYIYFHSNGYVYVINPSTGAVLSAIGKWSYDSPEYAQVTVVYNPCKPELCYTYAGAPNILYPSGTSTFCLPLSFSPPYGSYCNYSGAGCTGGGYDSTPSFLDSFTWSQSHQNDGQLIDMDNFCITHEECPSACCDNTTGICTNLFNKAPCPFKNYYPNVSCEQLGTPGFPPACGVARGSCCDASPGSGGVCRDGVLNADCPPPGADPRWYTWTKDASCDGFVSLCKSAELSGGLSGMCSSGNDPGKAPWHCIDGGVDGQLTPCVTNADCSVPGFCYGGHCTPATIPGHCEYEFAGFCQNMGRCSGSAVCDNPATGAGCCDTHCTTPVNCPSGETCLVEKQGCNDVPGGSDCDFCEGCDPWPTVSCSVLGAACAPPAAGFAPGTCVANSIYVCNGDADCPTPQSGGICVIPPVSPGGRLCTSHDVCVIPATQCGPEHTGSCCDGDDGSCVNDVLEATCRGGQKRWTKSTLCADLVPPCVRHTGACVDCSPRAGGPGPECGCTDGTYPEDCVGQQQYWLKYELCRDVIGDYTESTGACCEFVKGTCEDGVLSADCKGSQQQWTEKKFCRDVELAGLCDADLGACCDEDVFGGCTQTTANECNVLKKGVFYKLTDCSAITCNHKAIPTVSEWGIVVLTLLLLVGAKVYFGRRQAATA